MPITTVLLDGDGVLQYPPMGWKERILDLSGAADWAAVARVEDPLMAGGDPAPRLAAGFPGRRVDVADLLQAWNDTIVDAVALSLVDAVRTRGVRCYLASNQQSVRAAWMRTGPLAGHLDGLFFSCELGVEKPKREFFLSILDAVGAAPSEVLFVDDLPENVAGARASALVAEHKLGSRGPEALREILSAHGLL